MKYTTIRRPGYLCEAITTITEGIDLLTRHGHGGSHVGQSALYDALNLCASEIQGCIRALREEE